MIIKNLSNGKTYHYKNIPHFITEWRFKDGTLFGECHYLYVNEKEGPFATVYFPVGNDFSITETDK